MQTIYYWILAIRLKTLVCILAPISIAISLAAQINPINTFIVSLIVSSAILIQIGTNLANDYFDFKRGADTDARKGPKRVAQSGLISLKALKIGYSISFLMAFFIGCFLIYSGGYLILIIGLLSILSGYAYTGGPYPLGYNGLGDLFVFVFFGPVATFGTYYLLTNDISILSLVIGMCPGLISTGLLAVNNYRDRDEDLASGKRTLVVRFGRLFGHIEYGLCLLLPLVVVYLVYPHIFLDKVAFFIGLVLFSVVLVVMLGRLKDNALNALLGFTSLYLLAFTAVFCLGVGT